MDIPVFSKKLISVLDFKYFKTKYSDYTGGSLSVEFIKLQELTLNNIQKLKNKPKFKNYFKDNLCFGELKDFLYMNIGYDEENNKTICHRCGANTLLHIDEILCNYCKYLLLSSYCLLHIKQERNMNNHSINIDYFR